MEFENKTALEDYISHAEHGRTKERPGICYGFTVDEDADVNRYELELFFNDLFVNEYKSIPDQKAKAINSYQMVPKVQEYMYYSYYGFGYL